MVEVSTDDVTAQYLELAIEEGKLIIRNLAQALSNRLEAVLGAETREAPLDAGGECFWSIEQVQLVVFSARETDQGILLDRGSSSGPPLAPGCGWNRDSDQRFTNSRQRDRPATGSQYQFDQFARFFLGDAP